LNTLSDQAALFILDYALQGRPTRVPHARKKGFAFLLCGFDFRRLEAWKELDTQGSPFSFHFISEIADRIQSTLVFGR
jgi:hypothetical protein